MCCKSTGLKPKYAGISDCRGSIMEAEKRGMSVPGLEALKRLQEKPLLRKQPRPSTANSGCPGDGRAFAENADKLWGADEDRCDFWSCAEEEGDATSGEEEDSAAFDELLAVVEKERLAMEGMMQTPANEEGQQPSGLEAC